jgi:hypothetical protein
VLCKVLFANFDYFLKSAFTSSSVGIEATAPFLLIATAAAAFA